MIIDIHDVGHGACSVVTMTNGRRFMIDCGHSDSWSPSQHYAGATINGLLLQNLDHDHLSDLPRLLARTRVMRFFSNPTVHSHALAQMKAQFGMTAAVQSMHALLDHYGTEHGPRFDFSPSCDERALWHAYGADFTDTNNLSIPVFVAYGQFVMLFGGDMEEAGWLLMLNRPAFRAALRHVKIYVASHHGRENGCCAELFDFMRPDVVIISDYEHRYETQKTTAWYANRVIGIPDNTVNQSPFLPRPVRKVLTTRRDGHLKVIPQLGGGFSVEVQPALASGLGALSMLAGR